MLVGHPGAALVMDAAKMPCSSQLMIPAGLVSKGRILPMVRTATQGKLCTASCPAM